jgi:(p)ppGpp synthase/HD superfamily hydrolase
MTPEEIEHYATLASWTAAYAHRNQKRKLNGLPYLVHPTAVAAQLPAELKPVGYLHDVLEDNSVEYSEEMLRGLFPAQIMDVVVTLTRRSGEPYDDYVMRVAQNPAARQVKIADLRDNLKDLSAGSLRDKYRLALRLLGETP